jgi:hypothetical protein
MALHGAKVAQPLMDFGDNECLSVWRMLKYDQKVFHFIYKLANSQTHVVDDTMYEDYATVFCVGPRLYQDISYYVYLSSMFFEGWNSRVILRVSAIDIYDSYYAECDYIFNYGLCRRVDVLTMCREELRSVFASLANYFGQRESYESYRDLEDIQVWFEGRGQTLFSLRLIQLFRHYHTRLEGLSECCCPYDQ